MIPRMNQTSPALLTVPEAAAQLRVDPATVRRWIATGRLAASKPGRDYRIRADVVNRLATGEFVTNTSITDEDVAAHTRARLEQAQPSTVEVRSRLATS